MTDTDTPTASAGDQLVERLFGATLGALELMSVYLGWRLHLYSAVDDHGPLTAAGLAEAAGIDARYAREWLEQQAAAGFLTVDDAGAGEEERRYSLPEGYRAVLIDKEDMSHVAPFAPMVVGIAGALPEVAAAYRTGEGVPYTHYGGDFREGQGGINRPLYTHDLASWITGMADIHDRLSAGGRAVDLGCGQGWSTVALAKAYPHAEVIGVDTDVASVDEAVAIANAAGVQVDFRTVDAAGVEASADLVCIFEALHDMAQPIAVLQAARAHLAPGGAVLVVDERVEDSFTAAAGEVERMMYGWSVLHCLPACRVESPSAALGTVLRRPAVEALAAQAGFAGVRELDIENDFFRFYRLDP